MKKKKAQQKSLKNQPKKRQMNSKIKKAMDKEIQEIIDYLFVKISDKKNKKIDFDTLLKSLVAYDLIKDIDENDIEKMLETFSDEQTLNKEQFEELFVKCNINLKPYLIENQLKLFIDSKRKILYLIFKFNVLYLIYLLLYT